MMEITSETIERVEAVLAGVPKGAGRAISNAMNRGLSHVKTGAFKKIKEVYAVQNKALKEGTRVKISKASTGSLAGYVAFSGCKIPLYKFSVSPKKPGTGKMVKAGQMIGKESTFEHAFIANLRNERTGIFERTTKKRFPIKEIMGSSAAQMIQNVNVLENLEKEAQEVINQRLEHEIDRILSGYGG